MLYDIIQLTHEESSTLSQWYQRATESPPVARYLGTAGYNTPISIPDSDWDGIIFMDDDQNGILKLYFDHEINTAHFGIWVLPTERRSDIARDLMGAALGKLHTLPNMKFLASRVQSTNIHGTAFSMRYLGEPWGSEPCGAYDRLLGTWVDMDHYKTPITEVRKRLGDLS